jgi:hypothetical protein
MFQDIIDSYDEEPLRAKKSLPAPAVDPLLASAFEVADKSRVYIDHEVLSYIYANERYQGYGDAQAFREVMNYISDAENVHSNVLTSYTELLPDGHPRRPDAQSRADLAEYLSTQAPASIEDALIASICAQPRSLEREFNNYAIMDQGISYAYLVDLADSVIVAAAEIAQQDEVDDPEDDPQYVQQLLEIEANAEERLVNDLDRIDKPRWTPTSTLDPDLDDADGLTLTDKYDGTTE